MKAAWAAAALAVAAAPVTLHAQDSPASVSATVRDRTGMPMFAVVAEIETTGHRASTNSAGVFTLNAVPPGTHQLRLSKTGYLPRYVRIAIEDDREGNLNLGPIVLVQLEEDSRDLLTVTGTITDSETGEPVPSVAVGLNGTVIAMSNDGGTFRGVAGNVSASDGNRLTAQRIGYTPVDRPFRVPATVRELDFDIELDPTSVELEEITVEASAVSARLTDTGFYRREQASSGHFFTAEDIAEMNVMDVTDVLRRVPGATVLSQADAERTTGGGAAVRFLRPGMTCGGNPLLYVDNVHVPVSNLDLVRNPDRLAGVEVYTSGASTPPEYAAYNPSGNCGSIVLWTKDALGLNEPSPFQLGAHVGANFANGSNPDRVGGQLTVPFRGPLLVYLGFTQRTGGAGSAWQAFMSLQIKPFGTRNPLYVGMGVALDKPRLEMAAHHLMLAGLTLPVELGPLSPFTELQVVGPLTGHARAFGFAGVNLRIDAR